MQNSFESAIKFLPDSIRMVLNSIENHYKSKICEIRLRSEKPIVLILNDNTLFLESSGRLTSVFSDNLYKLSVDEMKNAFNRLCNFSVYSHSDSISQGFITLSSGHRVGIGGTAVSQSGKITSIRDINSLNIRIAREFKGCADEILKSVFYNRLTNLIIAGPPSSGKTTLLRDIARQVSSGRLGKYHKVSVIDERCEIAPMNDGFCCFDIGANTDVLSSFRKADGIMCALRTLSPDLIICDEIGTVEECSAIKSGMNSGVSFVLSIHASDMSELKNKPQFRSLLEGGYNPAVVMLSDFPCRIKGVYEAGEYDAKNNGDYFGCNGFYPDRSVFELQNA